MRDHLLLFPFLLPWVAVLPALGLGFLSARAARSFGLLVLGTSLILTFRTFAQLPAEIPWRYNLGGWPPPWGIEASLSSLQALFVCLLLVLAFFTLFYSGGVAAYGMVGRWNIRSLPAVLLAVTGSLTGLLLVRDAFSHYLLLQVLVLGCALLLGLACEQGAKAAFQWTLLGSAGASLLLWGVLGLWSATGTLHFGDLLAQLFILGDAKAVLAGGVFLTLGWAFLLVLSAPGPGVGTQPPPFLAGFLSGGLARTGALCLFFFYFSALNVPGAAHPAWLLFLEHLGVVLLFGLFGWAARRRDLMETLPLLGLAQFGFFFAGVLLGNKAGLTGALVELLAQTLGMAGLYFAAGTLRPNVGPQPLSRLAGLARRRPWTGMALIVFAASIAGVPPTAGFFGKYYLVLGALEKGDKFLLAVIGVTVLFNLVVFLRFLLLLFEHRGPSAPPEPPSQAARLPVLVLALGMLLLGLFHQAVLNRFIEPALPKAFLELPSPYVPFLGKDVE